MSSQSTFNYDLLKFFAMQKQGMSLRQLCLQLNSTSYQALMQIIKKRQSLRVEVLLEIADVLDMDVTEFFRSEQDLKSSVREPAPTYQPASLRTEVQVLKAQLEEREKTINTLKEIIASFRQ